MQVPLFICDLNLFLAEWLFENTVHPNFCCVTFLIHSAVFDRDYSHLLSCFNHKLCVCILSDKWQIMWYSRIGHADTMKKMCKIFYILIFSLIMELIWRIFWNFSKISFDVEVILLSTYVDTAHQRSEKLYRPILYFKFKLSCFIHFYGVLCYITTQYNTLTPYITVINQQQKHIYKNSIVYIGGHRKICGKFLLHARRQPMLVNKKLSLIQHVL